MLLDITRCGIPLLPSAGRAEKCYSPRCAKGAAGCKAAKCIDKLDLPQDSCNVRCGVRTGAARQSAEEGLLITAAIRVVRPFVGFGTAAMCELADG